MNYELKDWPSLPEQMVEDLLEYGKDCKDIVGGEEAGFKFPGDDTPVYCILRSPQYLIDWVKDNIPELNEDYFIGLQRFLRVPWIPIHVDSIRSYAYNNVLTKDEDTETCFYSNKILIDSIKYQKNKWYYHNASVEHNIINLNTGYRLAVTIFKVDKSRVGKDYSLSDEASIFIKGI